jgi:hypothetical protein
MDPSSASERAVRHVVSVLIDAVTLQSATEPTAEDIVCLVIRRLQRHRKALPWLERELDHLRWNEGWGPWGRRWDRALAGVMRVRKGRPRKARPTSTR